jgi:hypothetical protein
MITPNPFSAASYYKVGDFVTFAWNYTSISKLPKAVDVLVTCTANQHLYTLALNETAHSTGSIVWDTGKYQSTATVPLLTESYTLIIYDAESSISATARPGYLGTYEGFIFGMYTPQAYTPWSGESPHRLPCGTTESLTYVQIDFDCATCSAAVSQAERQTWAFLFGMMTITILSFTWFGSGFGVF